MVTAEDIHFVLSGGSGNFNASTSLGGEPSAQPISALSDNLFSDISEIQAAAGKVDYRCFYIFNDSQQDAFYDTSVYVDQVATGASVLLGVTYAIDIQRITISGSVVGGDIDLKYGNYTANVPWNATTNTWAANLQNALNAIPGLNGITVQGASSWNTVFTISFTGDGANRYHDLFVITNNLVTSSGVVTITTSKMQNGAPINSIAPMLTSELASPSNVNFVTSDISNPIVIGELRAGDGFPVWIRRTTLANSLAMTNDGFQFRLSGRPLI